MKHVLNFSLLLVAILLTIPLLPAGLLFTLIRSCRQFDPGKMVGYLSHMALSLALSIDLMGNVACRDLFNVTLIKPHGYAFGDNYETISLVLGVNKRWNSLTDAGRALANLLNWLDPGHVERAAGEAV